MTNRLASESSPYLLQHAANPVDWFPWGEEAFERARTEDLPVLLSVGYSACHWCHVMAHESFEDESTAALMNELFVSIKVDREERPDVDSVYMSAVQAMGVHGGWPLTVFLTPERLPFFGGTYFPPDDRQGMRGFPQVLRAVSAAYREQRAQIDAMGEQLRIALAAPRAIDSTEPSTTILDAAARLLVTQTDRRHGGFGAAPKFPHPQAVDLLLRRFHATGDRTLWEAAVITLDAMARGGIHDQVGGGFHRYSVDALWAVPHFEKMLYDNAQLAPVYLHAFQLGDRTDFRDVCTRTLDYLARELLLPDGGFAASQDADSPGGEGAFFVWTPSQLRDSLDSEDAIFAARVFGVTDAGNFEHGTTVLAMPYPTAQVARSLGVDPAALEARLEKVRATLFAVRGARIAPARDGKVITAWNALALGAFAEAGAVLGREDYLTIARRGADFLLGALVRDGQVMRTWTGGRSTITGFLDDVAHLCAALITVYECSGEARYLSAAIESAELIVARYRDPHGTYFDTADGPGELIIRPRTIEDNPVTAGQSAAAMAFARLHGLTGDARWHDRAMEIIGPLAAAVGRVPQALAGLGAAMELAVGPMREIAVAGNPADPATIELVATVQRRFDPARVLAWGAPDGVPLLRDRGPVDGRPAAYVCSGFVCAAPVTDVAALEAALAARATG